MELWLAQVSLSKRLGVATARFGMVLLPLWRRDRVGSTVFTAGRRQRHATATQRCSE